jgi:hypothetical protein
MIRPEQHGTGDREGHHLWKRINASLSGSIFTKNPISNARKSQVPTVPGHEAVGRGNLPARIGYPFTIPDTRVSGNLLQRTRSARIVHPHKP